jgi:hypothetical protein
MTATAWSATSPAPVGRRWRGRIWRKLDGQRALVTETCPHDHLKRTAAATCGERAARRLNRWAARPGHESWPSQGTIRNAAGHLIGTSSERRWDVLADRAYPLTAACQPCGQPITCPAKGAEWEHEITGKDH